ncbi:glycosyltransferase family 2 protein [Parabacteroides bouchesdurhonensis]|uniref:glycosyltransferase family 2 protein n=1 Tax=Parabacteroides bouchesdurhonensis TaxID=1936995 RepID=UPI00131EBEA4|nr:glycosyltransferase family 2 protein [Parabacteroides bouchesdurhonensis]
MQIIVPVYNVENYIEECMDSIVSQKSQYSFIITVVNDGSPDHSRHKLKKYESIPNGKIIDQENKGLSGARNTALKHIQGNYVMFVDSDDKLADGAIEKLMRKAIEWNADIVEGGYYNYSFNSKITGICKHPNKQHLKNLRGFPWGKVIKSTLMERIHFPEGYWFEDTVMFLIIFDLTSNMASISDIVYYYRQNNNGITVTSRRNPKALDTYYITKRLLVDRELLKLPPSQELYERFLEQCKINFNRTLKLPNKYVSYAIFEETAKLKRKYFKDFTSQNSEQLEKALEQNDFRTYLSAMI